MKILTRQHKMIKCLCCYQTLASKEQLQPLSWRSVDFTSEAPRFGSSGNTPYNVDLTNSSIVSHISHKAPHRRYIYPYTCVAEHCSMPHLLFATRKPWERLMKGDYARTWECILCEEGDISFTEVEDINIHIQTSHEDELRSQTLVDLVAWSETQSMAIQSYPLCSLQGSWDSPKLINHVVRRAFEFAFRVVPWLRHAIMWTI